MNVKRLKEILKDVDDDIEIFTRNSINIVGNISSLQQVEEDSYGFFGVDTPCLILNTSSSKVIEEDDKGEEIDYLKSEEGLTWKMK